MITGMLGLLLGICEQAVLSSRKRRCLPGRIRFLSYAVTWRCNSRCIMCDTWKAPSSHSASELSPSELESILLRDSSDFRHLKRVGITGGEPFMRSDIPELVRTLRRSLPHTQVSIVSNGFLTDRILAALREIRSFYPDLLFSVSVDGVGETHDSIRGTPGAYDKAMATIRGVLDLGFPLTTGMTVSPSNIDQIEPLADLMDRMGVDFSFNLPETGQNFHNTGTGTALTQEQVRKLVQVLERYPHHYYMDNLRYILLGRRRSLPCYAGVASYFLKPDGDLAVCNLKGASLGNLRTSTLSEVINGDEAKQKRHELARCSCWSQCEVKYSASCAPVSQIWWFLMHRSRRQVLARYGRRLLLLSLIRLCAELSARDWQVSAECM